MPRTTVIGRMGILGWLLLGALLALAPGVGSGAAEESKELARYVPPAPREPASVLLRRGKGADKWQRLEGKQAGVMAGDTLVSLPGYRSEVRFADGVRLQLLGGLPEISLFTLSLESMVQVRAPGKFDLDILLERGRIVLTNDKAKGQARARVRFANAVAQGGEDYWDITLPKKGDAVALELWGRYPSGVPFNKDPKKRSGPTRELYLFVVRGPVDVQIDDTTYGLEPPPGAGLLYWNSNRGTSPPRNLKEHPVWVTKRYPPFPKDLSKEARQDLERGRENMKKALADLSERLKDQPVMPTLLKALDARDASLRTLAVRCLGAVNDISAVVDALTSKGHPNVRQAAVVDLRHWTGLGRDNDLDLYALLVKKKKFSPQAAETLMDLLHTFPEEDLARPETYARLIDLLRSENPAVRVLAHWHLIRLVPGGFKIPYDPVGNAAQREKAYAAWKKLVPEGSVPQPPMKPKKPAKSEKRGQ